MEPSRILLKIIFIPSQSDGSKLEQNTIYNKKQAADPTKVCDNSFNRYMLWAIISGKLSLPHFMPLAQGPNHSHLVTQHVKSPGSSFSLMLTNIGLDLQYGKCFNVCDSAWQEPKWCLYSTMILLTT